MPVLTRQQVYEFIAGLTDSPDIPALCYGLYRFLRIPFGWQPLFSTLAWSDKLAGLKPSVFCTVCLRCCVLIASRPYNEVRAVCNRYERYASYAVNIGKEALKVRPLTHSEKATATINKESLSRYG